MYQEGDKEVDNLEQNIRLLVKEVVNKISQENHESQESQLSDWNVKGVFKNIDEAVQAAQIAHRELIGMTLEIRRAMIQKMRDTVIENLKVISQMAVDETTMGRLEDKMQKNKLAALRTPGVEDLQSVSYTDDHGLTLVERAPYGVVGAITPSTNPTETIINNSIGMISGGNSVVFNPHPGAKQVSCYIVTLLNEASINAGGPQNLICTVANPTIESAQGLMNHPNIDLLVVTGGPAVVKVAMKSSKKTIAAGPGNPPCVVDETADIVKAGRDIVNGASFDNNIVCICEKEILAVESIADQLKAEMKKNGAYELSKDEIDLVTNLVISDPGRLYHEGAANKKYVGKNADVIARDVGLAVPKETRLLLCEVDCNHPLVWTEQLMPVIPLVRVKNVDVAIDLAVSCEHGFRHTAMMHSKNIEKLSLMAKVMNCSIFIKNGPCYSGLGHEGAGFPSFTIASPTGDGLTRARTFTRERRCTLVDYFRIV